jgi:hypothetical protein
VNALAAAAKAMRDRPAVPSVIPRRPAGGIRATARERSTPNSPVRLGAGAADKDGARPPSSQPKEEHQYDHAHKVLDGKVGETLAAEHEKLGLRVPGWQDSWGYRNVVIIAVARSQDSPGLAAWIPHYFLG